MEKTDKDLNAIFNGMAEDWPHTLVAHTRAADFSNGIVHPRTLANLVCLGDGPPTFKIGRRKYSDKNDFVAWMAKRYGEKSL